MAAIYFSIVCAGPYSNAALNPTIGFTNLTFAAMVFDSTDQVQYLPAYVFGPICGGILAGLFTKFVSEGVTPDPKHGFNKQYPRMTV